MNILLVNPASKPGVVYSGGNNMYPFSLLFLSSYLYKNGYRAKVLDLSTSIDPHAGLIHYLKDNKVAIIGFTGTTENRFLVWDLIMDSKKVLPKIKIVVGGNHFTYTAQETLEVIPEIDVIVRGEGEITFLELIKFYDDKAELTDIPGISYRKDDKIIHNPDRPFEKDIDKFIIQDEIFNDVILPYGNYSPFMIMRNYEEERIKALPIHVGRGCPGRCVFCLYNKKRYRARTVDSVIQEIKRKRAKYSCDAFHLQDPHLLKRTRFIKEFCSRLIDEGFEIQWYAETRADIKIELLDLMKRAGCISLDFGLESASGKVLNSIKKGITVEQAEKLINKCSDLGIKIGVFTMISLPDETEEDALKTIRFIKSFEPEIKKYTYTTTHIYPGSELEIMAKEREILKKDFSWYDRDYQNDIPDLVTSCVPPWIEHLSPDFIRSCQKEYERIQMSRRSIPKLVLQNLSPFIAEWSTEGIRKKWRMIQTLFKYLYVKILYKSSQ